MNKCRNCGKEFEGKFCPECGLKIKQIVFDEFEVGQIAEVAERNQKDTEKKTDKKMQLAFNFVSKFTKRFFIIFLSSILFFCLTCYVLIAKDARSTFGIHSDETSGFGVTIEQTRDAYIGTAAICGIIFFIFTAVCILMLIKKRPILDYPELLQRRHQYKWCLKCSVSLVLFLALSIFLYVMIPDSQNLFMIIFLACFIVLWLAIFIFALWLVRKIEKKYIIKNSDGTIINNLTPIVQLSIEEFKSINAIREKRCNARREALGKVHKTAREVEKQYFYKKLVITAGAVILASVIFVVSVVTVQSSIFDIDKMEKISVGDSISYITRMLGEPYDKKEIKDSQDKVKSCTYYYCSSPLADDIAKINKKLDKFEDADDFDSFDDLDEMVELSEKLERLEEKLSKIKSDYITVHFESNKVTSLNFAKNCLNGVMNNDTVTKITYADANGKKYYKYGNTITAEKGKEEITVNARLYFGDGSLLNKQIKVKLNSGQTGVQNLTWSDSFGTHEIIVNLI